MELIRKLQIFKSKMIRILNVRISNFINILIDISKLHFEMKGNIVGIASGVTDKG